MTGLEWLKEILSNQQQENKTADLRIKRVLILQINPFPLDKINGNRTQKKTSQPETSQLETYPQKLSPQDIIQNSVEQPPQTRQRGLFMATLGTLIALSKVRDRILNSRNCTEVGLLAKWQWQDVSEICRDQGVEVKYFSIFFPHLPNGEEPPLSWKLTPTQKEEIKKGWEQIETESTVQEMKDLWQNEWNMK